MRWSVLFPLSLILCLGLIAIAVAGIMMDFLSMTSFWVLVAASVVVTILPLFVPHHTSVDRDPDGIRVRAPFVDVRIPFTEIVSLSHCTEIGPVGVRTMGLQTLRKSYGSFSNRVFGPYTAAYDARIPFFIVLRTAKRTYVLNIGDEQETRGLYDLIASNVGADVVRDRLHPDPMATGKDRRTRNIVIAVSAVLLAVCLAVVGWAMTVGDVDAEISDGELRIHATMMDDSVPLSGIAYVELRDDVDYGTRTMGLGNGKVLTGTFDNDEFGKYRLAVYRDTDLCIVVHHLSGTLVFNLVDDAETTAFHAELLDSLGASAGPAPSGAPAA